MQLRNGFWKDAVLCGLIIGAVMVSVLFMKSWFTPSPNNSTGATLFSLLELVAVFYCLHRFGKRRAVLYPPEQGYSFGQNIAFVVAVMLVAGAIFGVGYFIRISCVISTLKELTYGNIEVIGEHFKHPGFWTFFSTVVKIVCGGIVGLFVTPFVTRRPEVKNTQHDEQQA